MSSKYILTRILSKVKAKYAIPTTQCLKERLPYALTEELFHITRKQTPWCDMYCGSMGNKCQKKRIERCLRKPPEKCAVECTQQCQETGNFSTEGVQDGHWGQ